MLGQNTASPRATCQTVVERHTHVGPVYGALHEAPDGCRIADKCVTAEKVGDQSPETPFLIRKDVMEGEELHTGPSECSLRPATRTLDRRESRKPTVTGNLP